MTTDIDRRDTVAEIVRYYERICRETRAAYKLLSRSEALLRDRIYKYGKLSRRNSYASFEDDVLQAVLAELKCQTWKGIIDKLNVRGVMDSARRATLDKQLETGEGLPDITTDAVLGVIHSMIGQFGDFAEAAIKEAFELIRRRTDGYKSTGQAWRIEGKAVIGWMCEQGYGGKPFRLCYRSDDDARTIENAFMLLDGKGPCKSHTATFAGVLNSSDTGEGETEYFRFRAHKNGNLHMWFKRADLVERMNAAAGGAHVLRATA
jgi:hypothetical protein